MTYLQKGSDSEEEEELRKKEEEEKTALEKGTGCTGSKIVRTMFFFISDIMHFCSRSMFDLERNIYIR